MNSVKRSPILGPDLRRNKGSYYEKIKRGQDVILSLFLICLTAPLQMLLLLLIWLDSPGGSPVFTQMRVGKDGRLFRLYKLRTMVPGAEEQLEQLLCQNEQDGPAFKMCQDPRVTRMGRLLRRTCLDELPQLWNVLQGDMSLVGPRPALPREVARYDAMCGQRLQVMPGLTCYWQIQSNRNRISFREWMELDKQYIRERDLWTDWKILLLTIPAVMRMDGQ